MSGRLVAQERGDESPDIDPSHGPAAQPFVLPDRWRWVSFGDLILHSDSGWSPRTEAVPRIGDNWGVLKVSAVSWERFRPTENKQLLPGVLPRVNAAVAKGDFLIVRANTRELIAKAVLVDQEPQNLIMSDKIVRLKLSPRCSPHYALLVNNWATHARAYYAAEASGVSASMKNVYTAGDLRSAVPAPAASRTAPHRREGHRVAVPV